MTKAPTLVAPADRSTRRLRIAALISSLLASAIGVAWWFGDALWYFERDGERGEVSMLALLPQRLDAALFLVLGLLGAVTALTGRGRTMTVVAAVQLTAFAVLGGDIGVLTVLGYLTALSFPLVLVGTLLWGAARSRTAALGLGALAVVAGAALAASGKIDATSARELGSGLRSGLSAHMLPHLVVAGFVAHGLLWASLGVRGACARRTALGLPEPGVASVRSWRVPVTLLAAACALPYGLLRLTWLTGAPWGMSDADLDAEPGIRLMGLLLGLAGLVAATLTIGLLRPWGQVFPRWIPRIGGRPVPVLFPTLTAGIIGAVMAIAGRSMVQSYVLGIVDGTAEGGIYLLLIPLPLWGPALMLAAWGYYLHVRAATSRTTPCGPSSTTSPTRSPSTSSAPAVDARNPARSAASRPLPRRAAAYVAGRR